MPLYESVLKWMLRVMPPQAEWTRKRIFSFGDQRTADDNGKRSSIDGVNTANKWFTTHGLAHISVNPNGKDGALKREITDPVDDLGQFDFVANLGASSCVADQEACFAALHQLCRNGGMLLHVLPLKQSQIKGSLWYYDLQFARLLAQANGYGILDQQCNLCVKDETLLCVAFRRLWDGKLKGIPAALVKAAA
jgi:hypothetical protein